VSRQVRILEEQLGMRLFLRTHTGLEITDAGKRLAITVKEAFDHIANAISPAHADRDVVTIKVPATFALRWLFPRLKRFNEAYPTIKLVVQTRVNDITQDDADVDLGIRYGLGDFPNEDATELYQEWIVPVCAPGYLDEQQAEHLIQKATLLHPLPDRQDWVTWSEKTGIPLRTQEGLDFDAQDLALSAAETGVGVAVADVVLAHGAITRGAISIPIRRAVSTGVSYYLVRRPELRTRRQIIDVEEWIIKENSAALKIIAGYVDAT
jgi:LysR family glycine cleavage system transcriptional activator